MYPRRARQSESFTQRRREQTILFAGIGILAVVSWVAVLAHLSYLKSFTISVIEIQGVGQDIHGTVRAAATEAVRGNYFRLFSRANILLYSRASVVEAVEKASPRIEKVDVSRRTRNSLLITIKEKDPVALACSNFPDFDGAHALNYDGDDCAFVDESGVLYAVAPTISGTMYNRYYIPHLAEIATSSEARLGLRATSTDEFAVLQEFYDGLRKNDIDILAVLFKASGEYEAYAASPRAKTSADDVPAVATVIYFNNSRPLSVQLTHLLLFWTHALREAKSKSNMPSYEYIDVRYGSNVFFRESE